MNKEFQAAHNMYIALFRCTSEECVSACDLDSYDLREWGFSTESLADRMGRIDEISPMEFDTRSEYLRTVAMLKEKEKSLIVITAYTTMAPCVNYKGEFEKMVTAEEAKKLPEYVSKNDSYAYFGI